MTWPYAIIFSLGFTGWIWFSLTPYFYQAMRGTGTAFRVISRWYLVGLVPLGMAQMLILHGVPGGMIIVAGFTWIAIWITVVSEPAPPD